MTRPKTRTRKHRQRGRGLDIQKRGSNFTGLGTNLWGQEQS